MARRKRRLFTPEFKAETVRLIRESGKSIGAVARELDDPLQWAAVSFVARVPQPTRFRAGAGSPASSGITPVSTKPGQIHPGDLTAKLVEDWGAHEKVTVRRATR
jgi:hypothetical protein